ncbi:MAG: TerB family tellurite resistance protein [Armatimonadetes bacterium]|nr:TerB family tellurite resistance protein [Armatimonadota bacterium]
MTERKWTNGSYFGYLYIAFAGLTDNELSDVEKGEIVNCVVEWWPEQRDDVIDEIDKAWKWVDEDLKAGGIELVVDNVLNIAQELKEEYKEKSRKAILNDLVRIAVADNNFHENEKDWIRKIAEIFGIDFRV